MIDENVKAMYQGFFSGFDAMPAKDPELQKKIDDWKKRVESLAETITNIADFYPKYMDSGLSEEYTSLVSLLYTQDNNTNNHTADDAPAASGAASVISVKNFLEQYRASYDEVRKAGYRKRAEKAYENIFAVADRTNDMIEAQTILEQERLLWKIVSEDWNDIYEPIIEASDPLFASYPVLKLIHKAYRNCNSEEEMRYHGQRFYRPINIITEREIRPWWFALTIANLAREAKDARSAFWGKYLDDEPDKARKYAAHSLTCRDICRQMIQILKESYNLTYNDLAADKRVKPFLLAPQNMIELGRYKSALPPAQWEYYHEVVNEQIIPDFDDYTFLMLETRSPFYKMQNSILIDPIQHQQAIDYEEKVRKFANEKSLNLTYYKYKEALDNKNDIMKDKNDKMKDMMKAFES